MAAKRTATNDLNHENWDVDDDPEDAGSFKKAPEDVLKKRVIKTARRRQTASANSPTAEDNPERKAVFGNFTGFSSKSATSNSFSFLSNVPVEKPTSANTDKPKVNGVNHRTEMAHSPKPNGDTHSEEYLSKLKGLNESVSKWIKTHVDSNPFIDIRPIFSDYTRYFNELDKSGPSTKVVLTEKTVEVSAEAKKGLSTFMFKSPTGKSDMPPMFSAGSNKPEKGSSSTDKITFGVPAAANTSSSSPPSTGLFMFKSPSASKTDIFGGTTSVTSTTGMFSAFGGNATTTTPSKPTTGFGFSASSTPFTFSNVSAPKTDSTVAKPSTETNEDEDEPPKVEFTPVDEDGHIYKVRCKVFVKKDSTYGDRGVGNLFLKPIPNSEKVQLIVRADTNLGNLLCNFVLSASIPTKRMGKKDVMLICIPTPDMSPPPVSILLRVKSPEDADDLLKILDENKK